MVSWCTSKSEIRTVVTFESYGRMQLLICCREHSHTASISIVGLRVKTLRGSGCDWLLPPVPVTQYRKKKDRRHAGQSACDKENAVGMNDAVGGAQTFDLSARKPLQDLSQPGIG